MSPPVAALRLGSLALAASLTCWLIVAATERAPAAQTSPAPQTPLSATSKVPESTSQETSRLESQLTDLTHDLASLAARHDELLQAVAGLRRMLAQQPTAASLEHRIAAVLEEVQHAQRPEPESIPWDNFSVQFAQQAERTDRLQQQVLELQQELARLPEKLSDQMAAYAAPTEPSPLLITKLYRPLRLRADALRPMVQPLLTPEIGLWTTMSLPEDERDAILICDRPEVLAQVDRLITELDQPLPGLEFELSLQEIDTMTGRPASLATPLTGEQFQREGSSLIVPESVLQPQTATSEHSPRASTAARVLRITPRLVR